mgnify:CR=1 FL=1
MKYIIVQECSIEQLVAKVNSYLIDGWKCQGGICAVGGGSTGTGRAYYHQAMTK